MRLIAAVTTVLSIGLLGQEKAQELKPEQVVIEANKAEFEWYKDLESTEAAQKVKKYFTGSRYDNIVGRVSRAIKRGDKAKSAYNNIKILGSAEVKGDTAIVRTTESGELAWTPSGIRWPEGGPTKDLAHTYFLVRINGQWKVSRDEFEQ
ncbi:MAG: hypothetical protein Q8R08_00050 [bacterium]|nr:hypothetical protein [bacterium]